MRYIKTKNTFFILLFLAMAILPLHSENKKAAKTKYENKVQYSIPDEVKKQFDYYFYEAIREREKENYDVAIELLMKCYYLNSHDDALMYEFANIYALKGDINSAILYLANAVSLDKNNIWYQINLANLYLAIEDLAMATDIFEFTVEKFPDREEINYNLVELYLKQNRYQKAVEVLYRIEKKEGINEDVSFEKFRIYYNVGKKKEAFKEIDVLINKFPKEMKYRILRGNIYLEEEDFKNALAQYNYVLEREADNGAARFAMAGYYEKTGEQDKAIAEMDYALRSKNIDVETKIGILVKYLEIISDNEDWEKRTSGLFETLIENHYGVPEIHHYYAVYLISLEKYNEAVKELETILDIKPQYLEAWYAIVEVKMMQNKMEDVIDIANDAINIFPDMPIWHLYKGIAYYQLKNFDESISEYSKGLALVSDNNTTLKSDFLGQLGDAYIEKNEKEKAFASYEEAIKLNRANAHVLNNYSYYLAINKTDLAKAEEMIKSCLRLVVPPPAATLDTYAWILFQQGYFNLAKKYIEEAIQNGGSTEYVIFEHYGDILFKTGAELDAIKAWEKSLELGNKSETLKQKIEQGEYIE
jgi:tetratricopeptide (TPR) repeat protein